MSYTREPMIQSCDTGQQVPYFDSCLLIMFMSNQSINLKLNTGGV